MKIEFERNSKYNEWYDSVVLFGVWNQRNINIAFAREALAELFGVPDDALSVWNAFDMNKPFMHEIAQDIVDTGKLREVGNVLLEMKDLRPYFENRVATARV